MIILNLIKKYIKLLFDFNIITKFDKNNNFSNISNQIDIGSYC